MRKIGAVDSSRNANLRNSGSIVKVTDGQSMKNMQKSAINVKGNLKSHCPFAVMPAAAALSHDNKEAPLTLPSGCGYVGYW